MHTTTATNPSQLRPHVKTSKTVQAALLQTGGRKSKIVVSTLAEAAFYADAGFDDILYAVPITMVRAHPYTHPSVHTV